MKRIFIITGANGFLGNNIVRKLTENAENEVRGLVLPGDALKSLDGLHCRIFHGDVTKKETLTDIFDNTENAEVYVIHCAAIVYIKTKFIPQVYNVNVNGTKNIAELAEMDISELSCWLDGIEMQMSSKQAAIAKEILKEIRSRLHFLVDVGLEYLNLNRASATLSGGESQRIRLATQIGSQLVNVLYILDEPSIGLHQRDNTRLIRSLKQLRDAGNSIIVVEHDKEMMLEADYVIDMGPRAGRLGGKWFLQELRKKC